MTEIRINNAKFYSYHGVLDYEKEFGNTFCADIRMLCDLSGLGTSDDLSRTVDYLAVYKLAESIFSSAKYDLIETLAELICDSVLKEFDLVMTVTVRIRKPNAPLGIIDSVEIIRRKDRN